MRFIFLLTLAVVAINADWKASNIDRSVDVSTQVVRVSTLYTFENTGTSSEKQVKILLTEDEFNHLAFIAATVDGERQKLKISNGSPVKNGLVEYSIELYTPVPQGGQVKIRANSRFTHALEPLPAKIKQSESQFVVYQGSAYTPSAYPVVTQKTTIKTTAGGKTLSATNVAPTKQETEKVIYGPYSNVAPFESKSIRVHYENNFPFVVATLVERTIEVSHWGNIAVEEYIELVHKGAELEGTFSRIDHQMDRRGRHMPALQHFTTVLPATARDIYYRDEIGNISTSAVRIRAQSVDVEIKPRFPLFGGWKTSYVLGYNVPSHEYLYRSVDHYALKMKIFDHIFDNIVVEKVITKIVLPEHIKRVKLQTPYAVERKPDELRPTYLDTIGRFVVVIEKENVVSDHSQVFTLVYEFNFNDLIREPLMATFFFMALLTVVIIYGRFDFTIVEDPQKKIEERRQKVVEVLSWIVEKKQTAYVALIDAASEFKTKRDDSILTTAKSNLSNTRNTVNTKLSSQLEQIKNGLSAEAAEKAAELLKNDKAAFESVDSYLKAVEKSTSKTAGSDEQQFLQKVAEARTRADNILSSI